ncbi:MAG: hypothetical protein HY690_04335 [Chloroflexi bacterium]|nr:hypothetical protein [Chloroflexota bacterium]
MIPPRDGPCLALLDCSGIQDYVFGSNRLADNVGASYLVEAALNATLEAALVATLGQGAIAASWRTATALALDPRSSEGAVRAEVLYVGGGNAVVLFAEAGQARAVLADLGRRLLERSPGLRVAASLVPWAPGGLKEALKEARRDLGRRKLADTRRLTPFSHPVVETCRVAGLPAACERDDFGRTVRLSSLAAARRDARGRGDRRLRGTFDHLLGEAYDFPSELEQLGQRAGESHIAVVHADGDGLGLKLREIIEAAQDDQEVAAGARAFALRVEGGASRALQRLVETLLARLHGLEEHSGIEARFSSAGTLRLLPMRPIVYGGDDVTFVCDGRLGIQLAALFLEDFAEETEGLTACAGVAIVGSHFPFSRAYRLAEELCRSAKKARRDPGAGEGSWLDFHITFGGVSNSIEAIRQQDYGGTLLRRPWRVTPDRQTTRDLSWLLKMFKHLSHSEPWSRSRLRALRDALEQGPEASARLLRRLESRQATLGALAQGLRGWFDGRVSPLYDVLEAFEFLSPVLRPDFDRSPELALGGGAP